MSAGGPRIVHRNYFSWHFLWNARHTARLAGRIEDAHDGQSIFDIEHRSYVFASIQASVGFLEAAINEVYKDAVDGHAPYVSDLPDTVRKSMIEIWNGTDGGDRLRTVAKYQLLLTLAGHDPLDPGSNPYQTAQDLIVLRNIVVHSQSEDVAVDEEHRMSKRLEGKFPDNRLMAGSGNPWWPDHCLGSGCAEWAVEAAAALANEVFTTVGITPNYMVHDQRPEDWPTPGAVFGSAE